MFDVGGGAAGVHHRLLRRVAAVLPRRRHRRPGRERHGQRPGGGRRPAAVPVGRLHPRGGLPGRRPGPDRRLDGRRRRRGRASRSSPATPRWCSGARPTAATSTPPGVGVIERPATARRRPRSAPATSSSCPGPIGDHGVTIMLARGELDIEAEVCLRHRAAARPGRRPAGRRARASAACATRPGAASPPSCNEIAQRGRGRRRGRRGRGPGAPGGARGLRAARHRPAVRGLRGPARRGGRRRPGRGGLAALRAHPLGEGAAVIGRVAADPPGLVLLKTAFGGTRIVDLLVGDPLPRIC